MRKVIASMVGLAMVLTMAAKCPKGTDRPRSEVLPRTTVVTVEFSSTAPGFSWQVKIAGERARNKPAKAPAYEKTRDHTERVEVVKGQDVTITAVLKGWAGAVVSCRMTVAGGLQKKHQIATSDVSCAQNISAIFDDREYD